MWLVALYVLEAIPTWNINFSLWFIHVKAIVAAIRETSSQPDYGNENNCFFQ